MVSPEDPTRPDAVGAAVALAAALGPGWSARNRYDDAARHRPNEALLSGPDGIEVVVAGPGAGWYAAAYGRLALHGLLPDGLAQPHRLRAMPRSITVAAGKTPTRMAGDVRRRLLPNLAEITAEARKDAATLAAAQHDQEHLVGEIYEAFGRGAEDRGRGVGRYAARTAQCIRLGGWSDPISGHAEVPQGNYDVTFELRITKRHAVEVARFLGRLRAETTPTPLDCLIDADTL